MYNILYNIHLQTFISILYPPSIYNILISLEFLLLFFNLCLYIYKQKQKNQTNYGMRKAHIYNYQRFKKVRGQLTTPNSGKML